MSNLRQTRRRELFADAIEAMPYWETWDEVNPKWTEQLRAQELAARYGKPIPLITSKRVRVNALIVHRRKRRDMARKLSRKQWRINQGLEERANEILVRKP